MAMVDIGGGQYRDLDTERQYLDVIAEKISFEFADIMREMLDETNADFEEIKEHSEYLDTLTDEYLEVFQNVSNLSEEFIRRVEQMPRIDRKKIINMFKDIRNEVNQYT